MKFKIDENLPIELADELTKAGHDAQTVFEQRLQGQSDALLVTVCQQETRILVTLDLDFADIHAYPPRHFPGFIVLRPHWQDKPHMIELVRRMIPLLWKEPVEHYLWIVEESRIRIRNDESQ